FHCQPTICPSLSDPLAASRTLVPSITSTARPGSATGGWLKSMVTGAYATVWFVPSETVTENTSCCGRAGVSKVTMGLVSPRSARDRARCVGEAVARAHAARLVVELRLGRAQRVHRVVLLLQIACLPEEDDGQRGEARARRQRSASRRAPPPRLRFDVLEF